jgi:hypothetical protein
MRQDYLDANFRRTARAEDAVFVETRDEHVRSMRLYERDTIEASLATCEGHPSTPIPDGQMDREKMILGKLEFTWELHRRTWKFDGEFYSIEIMTNCCREDAESWLDAFFAAEKQSVALHHGKKVAHLVGIIPDKMDRVADANDRTMSVGWYNLADTSRLFAVALTDATKESEHPIELTRMIHHEVAHCYEPAMRDWLGILTIDVAGADLDAVAQKVNPMYLPSRITDWKAEGEQIAKRNCSEREKRELRKQSDESLAAEFLVESYVHAAIEKKPWQTGLWPTLDAVVGDMQRRVLSDHLDETMAHQPLPSKPPRVMYAPKTILVKDTGPERQVPVSI